MERQTVIDPDPTNELGSGVIDPTIEVWLLANGFIYARRLPSGTLIMSKRPMAQAMADFTRSLVKLRFRKD